MSVVTLGTWLFRRQRLDILLALSVLALYLLQRPDALNFILPTATVLLVIGVWWLVTPAAEYQDRRAVLLIAIVAAILPLSALVRSGPMSWVYSALALGSVVVGTVTTGTLIPAADTARRRLAAAYIVLIVIMLVILKAAPLQRLATNALNQSGALVVPFDWSWLGFSYIAFRLMHVLLDFRSGKLRAVNLRDFALYVTFYPALPAGPIDRIEHFSRELADAKTPSAAMILDGAVRIGTGIFKKFVVADLLVAVALSPLLAAQADRSAKPWMEWLMLYALAFQIYFDFAGYSDIAIGIGMLAGIKLPENFNAPYSRRNITTFWNNWHITLSTWFRSYFFTPFSRFLMQTPLRTHRSLMILVAQLCTMVLIGLWHGIAVNFVLWGLWHGIGLWAHKWLIDHTRGWDEYVKARPRLASAVNILSILATFHFVALGWIFFALPDLRLIVRVFAGLIGR